MKVRKGFWDIVVRTSIGAILFAIGLGLMLLLVLCPKIFLSAVASVLFLYLSYRIGELLLDGEANQHETRN